MQSRLEVTVSLPDKIFLGSRTGELDTGDVPANITRVNLSVDSDHYYTAGDDAGRAIEVTCPWGSQAMADSILASVSGKTYQPFTATDALLDPAAEIGDAVTVGGYYSVIANINTEFDRACAPTISAPESDEIDDEYPYESKERRETNRKLAQTRSLISKTSEEILLKVEKELEGLSSSFSVQLQQITARVNGLEGDFTEVSVTLNGLTVTDPSGKTVINGSMVQTSNLYVNAANITGTLTANQIDATDLHVNAANITGSLVIGQLPDNVATTGDIPDRVSELENDEGYQTERGVVTIIDGTVDADYVNALGIRARYLQGETVQLLSSSGSLVGAMDIVNTNTGDGLTIGTNRGGIRIETGQSGNIYISSSYGPFLMLGYGDTGSTAMCQLGGGPLVLPGASYGNRAPSGSGEYGEVYFQLE